MQRSITALHVAVQLLSAALAGPVGAADPFADCEARLGARPDSWASYCFVEVAREHGLWAEAERRVEAHRGRRPADPYLRSILGFLELEGGELPEAAEHFHAAAEAFAGRADRKGEALAWMNLAGCRMQQDLLDSAEKALRRGEEAARAAADQDLLTRVMVQQTDLVVQRGGDLERADRALEKLEEELEDDAGYTTWRSVLYERAALAQRLGRYDAARRINQRWAERARHAEEPRDEATALANLAIAVMSGAPHPSVRDEAIRRARMALTAAETAGNRAATVTAHRLLGKLLAGREGRSHLEACHRLAVSADDEREQVLCLFALAGSLIAEDPEQARLRLDKALTRGLASENPWTAAYGWGERFRVSWATRSRSEAAADSLAVLDHIETLRRLQTSESGRAGFFTDWVEVYHSLAGHLLNAPDGPSREELEAAFSVAERLRARVLLDSLAAARVEARTTPHTTPETPVAEERIEERTGVLREIVRVQKLLQNPGIEKGERTGLLTELERLERDLAELDERVGGAAVTTLPEHGFVGLSEVEEALAPEEAVLAFLVAPDEDVYGKFAGGSWLLAVTSSGTRAHRLPGRTELEAKVATFLGLVEARDDAILEPGAVTLYDDLLGTALAALPGRVEELILVPDGVLHLLPFGLLRPHPQADPLAATHRLSWVPSATLWHRWRLLSRTDPTPAPAAALALADPAFVGSSLSPEGSGDPLASEDRSWALEAGSALGRLPYAAREGRAVVRRLGGPPSRLRLGDDASEAYLKSAALADFGVLHFAAHALVDEERPRRSAVLLAAGAPGEDGLLQPREIAALDLAGKLVVVSACESGSGRVLLGEGVQSLARAFFRAGARAVVASLWRLEDDEAAEFFDLFYRGLAGGESVAASLAHARREMHRDGAPAAAWAGVVVLGDGGMVPLPGGVSDTRGSSWFVVELVVVAGVLVWWWRRRRRER